jgi:hypothetical protein
VISGKRSESAQVKTFRLQWDPVADSSLITERVALFEARSLVRGSVEHPRSLVAGRRQVANDNLLYRNQSNIAHHVLEPDLLPE